MATNLRKDAVRSRRAILAAARDLYRDDTEASFAEIAQAAQVGQATVYRHFADRRALLVALAEEDMGALEERHRSEAVGPGSFFDLLREMVAGQLRSQGLIAAIRAGEVDEHQVERLTGRVRALIAPRLEAARAAGLVRPDLTADDALTVLAMVDGAVAPLRDRAARARASARAFEIALDGLRVRP
ncbi:MAG TPA: helix-turn-helix domain-containing protein [Solirubrobacterales bacterium]|nr:helix-turn-helix domain-containing protein [Solirubrobacterales bacterium]